MHSKDKIKLQCHSIWRIYNDMMDLNYNSQRIKTLCTAQLNYVQFSCHLCCWCPRNLLQWSTSFTCVALRSVTNTKLDCTWALYVAASCTGNYGQYAACIFISHHKAQVWCLATWGTCVTDRDICSFLTKLADFDKLKFTNAKVIYSTSQVVYKKKFPSACNKYSLFPKYW